MAWKIPEGRIKGPALKTLLRAIQAPGASRVLARVVRRQIEVDSLEELSPLFGEPLPQDFYPRPAARTLQRLERCRETELRLADETQGKPALTSLAQVQKAYAAGLSPLTCVERAIQAIDELAERMPPMTPFHRLCVEDAREAARESATRHASGTARGVFDGVLVPIKEELPIVGLPCQVGSQVADPTPATEDALVVRRLREAGAIILGSTVMTEYGLSTIGASVVRKMPRNVHHPERAAGGSSTGSAVAVGLGLAPIAIGTDAAGSIRVPAAYNGLFGLKPTYGRIPLTGDGVKAGASVVHMGPIASTVRDLAETLEVLAGPDAGDDSSLRAPELRPGQFLQGLSGTVDGMKIGVVRRVWNQAHEEVATVQRIALRALEAAGAEVVELESDVLPHAAAIGHLSIGLEGLGALRPILDRTHEMGPELRVLIAALGGFKPDDYVVAQRLRGVLRREVRALFEQVDLIALPTVGIVPPRLSEGEMLRGFVDPAALHEGCRFSYLANLLGLPAATAPVGDLEGLPIGLQLVGDAWDEATVLTALAQLERSGAARVRRSSGAVDLLEED